ncbi:MAG: helix-turn-helix domain-containing protein [Oscillospiraceae bacterium]|nr:helix-turn-helix domain-containing protein [Oscillospiraceae bacterium]
MRKDINIEIGNRIVQIRKDMNLSQTNFATLCDMSKQSLCNIEHGKNGITIDMLVNICNATGISTDYIILNKIDQNTPPYYKKIENKLLKYSEKKLKNVFKIINDITIF